MKLKRTYNSNILSILAIVLWGFILYSSVPFYYRIYFQKTSENTHSTESNSKNCNGLGDANCQNKLIDNINGITGLQVSSSTFIGNGKFNTTILKENPNGSGLAPITTTITVDCNCLIVDSGNANLNY
jgi:hypothetical protein